MRAFFSSEEMELNQLVLHMDNAFDCLMEAAHYGGLQFNNVYDEDHMLNGLYTSRVLQCKDLLRIVDYLKEQLATMYIKEVFYPEVDTEYRPRERMIPIYDEKLRSEHKEISGVMEHFNTLEKRIIYLEEKRFALLKANKILDNDESGEFYSESTIELLIKDQSDGKPESMQLNYILGSVRVDKFEAFELLLYRLFGRNVLLRFEEMPRKSEDSIYKYVVLMMCTATKLRPKLLKCCQAFHVVLFECPERPSQRMLMVEQLEIDIEDIKLVRKETNKVRKELLDAAATDLYVMRINLRKSVRIYDLLNRLYLVSRDSPKYLQAECFTPKLEVDKVRAALSRGMSRTVEEEQYSSPPILMKRAILPRHTPPTYFKLNKFTRGFQALIDSYGMADYRELNPAPYTIITFPFLFAVMFGDLGHGIILTLFACFLIIQEKKIEHLNRTTISENEILNIVYAGRYIVLLMGLFSIYIGLIYNDVMALPMNLFGSSWSAVFNASTIASLSGGLVLNANSPEHYSGNPYPIGVDPMWKISGEDSIIAYNSLKMKMAIILGIAHMMFGIVLSAFNCIHLKRKADLVLVVLPFFIFMLCIFCYLVFLIFYKWLTYGGHKKSPLDSACAPSVLITFIDMMLMKTSSPSSSKCNRGMFPYERTLEYILVFVAIAAVPVLLAGKPIYLTRRQKQLAKERENALLDDTHISQYSHTTILDMRTSLRYFQTFHDNGPQRPSAMNTVDDAVEFDMSEIWIHSAIHTIECILGSVSHTASYLRLWALSLAHSQLADVLWSMVLERALKNRLPLYLGVPILLCGFLVWAVLTVTILVMMEGLSAFLHTLRLHWVEFQSKFYSGTGEPFSSLYFPPSTIRS